MFKYVKYTPMTDPYTTHIFNEKDDKCRVHRFDVPYVSVEYEKESDFSELMSMQDPRIEALEMTKLEFYDIVQHSDQVKRMYEIANENFIKSVSAITLKYSNEEMATWPSQVEEARAIKSKTNKQTPFLSALAYDDKTTLIMSADKILKNKNNYDLFVSNALVSKWETISKLKAKVGL